MPDYNENNCVSCGECANQCPVGAIDITDRGIRINESECVGCGACCDVCPYGALRM